METSLQRAQLNGIVLKSLKAIKQNGPTLETQGICDNLDCYIQPSDRQRVMALLHEKFPMWSEFSGSPCYPVPAPYKHRSSSCHYVITHNMWIGDYGDTRRRLLDFLIAEFEEDVRG